jgi:hypothetical protein
MNKNKTEFIRKVQEIGNWWLVPARESAMQAVRDGKKESMEDARRDQARHDACHNMADQIVKLVHDYWPVDIDPFIKILGMSESATVPDVLAKIEALKDAASRDLDE